MKTNSFRRALPVLFLALGAPSLAFAQEAAGEAVDAPVDGTAATEDTTVTAPPNDGDLPSVRSDDDPHPEVASPGTPAGGIVSQAGVGGNVGYGRAGVLELGGNAGFTFGKDISLVNISPTIGWFVADNFQLSAALNFNYAKAGGMSQTSASALIEPSYHLPFNRTVFGFFGLGVGAAYIEGPGTGLTIAPRLGMNLMVGRSGILSPSVSVDYTTTDSISTGGGQLLAVSTAARLNIGYTVMW